LCRKTGELSVSESDFSGTLGVYMLSDVSGARFMKPSKLFGALACFSKRHCSVATVSAVGADRVSNSLSRAVLVSKIKKPLTAGCNAGHQAAMTPDGNFAEPEVP